MLNHIGRGLVLRRTRHMEQDVRLTVFLRDVGKILVLAKGGLKSANRLKALQDPLTEAEYHVLLAPQGIHARLIGGKLIASPHHFSKNWGNFSLASKCCEVVDSLLPFRAPSPDVYDILHLTLQRLATDSLSAQHWIQFNLRLLNALGYGELTEDVLRLLQPDEFNDFHQGASEQESDATWQRVSAFSLNRCQAFLEARLNALLPWPLKSDAMETDEARV